MSSWLPLDIDVWQSGTTCILQDGIVVKGLSPKPLDPLRYHVNSRSELTDPENGMPCRTIQDEFGKYRLIDHEGGMYNGTPYSVEPDATARTVLIANMMHAHLRKPSPPHCALALHRATQNAIRSLLHTLDCYRTTSGTSAIRSAIVRPYLALSRTHAQVGTLNCLVLSFKRLNCVIVVLSCLKPLENKYETILHSRPSPRP